MTARNNGTNKDREVYSELDRKPNRKQDIAPVRERSNVLNKKQRKPKNKKTRTRNRILIILALFFLISILASAAIISQNQIPVIDYQKEENREETEEELIRVLNGEPYVQKKNIETYLFMGIDDPGKVRERTEYDGTGQCDMVILLVRDKSNGTYMTLPLDRNTMMDIKCLDIDGTYLATVENQLALAHADGNGLEMSCENVVDAVSNFLGGQQIDGYAAINMGAIEIINHLIGGVTVLIEDDFSKEDPTMKTGETITLTDEQAVVYVRGRMAVADGTNANRIKRQNEYMKQAEEKLRELCTNDSKFPLTLYEALQDYMVTNISDQKFAKLALLAAKDKSAGSLKLEGETVIGELDYEEFHADQESLEAVMAQLFYRKYE